jgi:hypothetical protein
VLEALIAATLIAYGILTIAIGTHIGRRAERSRAGRPTREKTGRTPADLPDWARDELVERRLRCYDLEVELARLRFAAEVQHASA